jgi:hypothetical protein
MIIEGAWGKKFKGTQASVDFPELQDLEKKVLPFGIS